MAENLEKPKFATKQSTYLDLENPDTFPDPLLTVLLSFVYSSEKIHLRGLLFSP